MSTVTASVIIPSKNAGTILRQVLTAVTTQSAPFDYEVIVVDSGSSDGTLDLVRSFPDVTLLSVTPESFGHGRTRNFAASHSSGQFLVFITHDAIPFDANWLANLVTPLLADDTIAGAFGRHIAHQGADKFVQRDLQTHFAGFLAHPLLLSRDTDPQRYRDDPGWKSLLHFFSNNNSCLRRSVWDIYPFPDVEFSEDQIWAKTIIDAGYSKLYVPDAVVAHSHSYGPMSQMRRAFDEAAAFRALFGYRLSPTLRRTLRTAVGFSARDIKFGLANRVGVLTILRRVGQDIGLAVGHFLGTHAERLPPALRRSLSHDRRLLDNLRDAAHR